MSKDAVEVAEQDIDDPLPLEEMRRELMIAEEQVQQGLVSPLDMDTIIAEGHEILAARRTANRTDLSFADPQMTQDEVQAHAETVEGIRRGWEACEQGRSQRFQKFAAEQRAKFNLSS